MDKEVLTHERILWDYQERMRRHAKTLLGLLIFLLLILSLMVFASIKILAYGFHFRTAWILLVTVGWFCLCIAAVVSSFKDYQTIKQRKYYVVTDELIGKQNEERYYVRPLNAFSELAKLQFRSYGTYIPDNTSTSGSSDRFAVSDADNFYAASNGDEFLLVVNRKAHIFLIYNAKLFEYRG